MPAEPAESVVREKPCPMLVKHQMSSRQRHGWRGSGQLRTECYVLKLQNRWGSCVALVQEKTKCFSEMVKVQGIELDASQVHEVPRCTAAQEDPMRQSPSLACLATRLINLLSTCFTYATQLSSAKESKTSNNFWHKITSCWKCRSSLSFHFGF
jgi:hypothetical protein